ncbi:signal recognition particle receptor subunit beta [Lepeophtheirus salmonis]|uniref:Signal recognition particle receptor subunit beta n=2 Tax=Lepeophtheirus salmonis TaxID=72036 RepID=D3PFZ3_LEPSM|nr:signal recognition particle receptor subunit beta-like isoform X2 [Lepeophtheirus salmonis]XP_040583837.1 signal recognition particle receptor subunit beta-like isoform X2 [Lepeophtheirus salmonis]XP_040583838.1 signal recognition particle receptor subunit beta-like isoform X2 [Lepeophtheirus salmonis]XP_040583839.1 signal recognition particle receptor subunit beta-like isoform X2 [Lepeophtheirus salmonis]ADD24189.1 Signal recognition particle receptor subunit beta [Lepeophtheirus salmonis]
MHWEALGILLVCFLVLLSLLWFKKKRSKVRNIILVGPTDTGKTTIFMKLLHGVTEETFTSLTCNKGSYTVKDNGIKIDVVDIPGHERIRKGFVDKFKGKSPAVAYVLDASTFESKLRDAGEFLCELLKDPILGKNNFAIVCNKQDLSNSKGISLIRRRLEEEINLLHEIHSRSLNKDEENASSTSSLVIKSPGKDFTFSNLKANVQFLEASATDQNGLMDLQSWLRSVSG